MLCSRFDKRSPRLIDVHAQGPACSRALSLSFGLTDDRDRSPLSLLRLVRVLLDPPRPGRGGRPPLAARAKPVHSGPLARVIHSAVFVRSGCPYRPPVLGPSLLVGYPLRARGRLQRSTLNSSPAATLWFPLESLLHLSPLHGKGKAVLAWHACLPLAHGMACICCSKDVCASFGLPCLRVFFGLDVPIKGRHPHSTHASNSYTEVPI